MALVLSRFCRIVAHQKAFKLSVFLWVMHEASERTDEEEEGDEDSEDDEEE
jgi:hypothetical protein